MTEQTNLFSNPLFRYGVAVMSASVILVVAFRFVEADRVRMLMFAIAAIDLVVTPQVLKRAAGSAARGADAT